MHSRLLLLTVFSFAALSAEPLIQVQMAPVKHSGNPPDSTGFGAVPYDFRIGKYEVSIAQYCAFLNAVAKSDPHSLYNSLMATDLNVAGIRRAGEPGSSVYEVVGSPNRPISQ